MSKVPGKQHKCYIIKSSCIGKKVRRDGFVLAGRSEGGRLVEREERQGGAWGACESQAVRIPERREESVTSAGLARVLCRDRGGKNVGGEQRW